MMSNSGYYCLGFSFDDNYVIRITPLAPDFPGTGERGSLPLLSLLQPLPGVSVLPSLPVLVLRPNFLPEFLTVK